MRTRVTLRLDFDDRRRLGHRKIALLEAIRRHGSIAAAAREFGMAYRRAGLLVDELNGMFAQASDITALIETLRRRRRSGRPVREARHERGLAGFRETYGPLSVMLDDRIDFPTSGRGPTGTSLSIGFPPSPTAPARPGARGRDRLPRRLARERSRLRLTSNEVPY
jgi:molybdenum-dependent DNA-binding transcriptional regulator ModE